MIAFSVFNRVNASRDDSIGTVDLDIKKIMELGAGVVDDWFLLKPSSAFSADPSDNKGSIKLRLSITPSACRS